MHPEAAAFLRHVAASHPEQARGFMVEFGSRVMPGQGWVVRGIFAGAAQIGVDPVDGDAVDRVMTAAEWVEDHAHRSGTPADFVVCAEVLQHDPEWPATVRACVEALRPGGVFAITWGTPSRIPSWVEEGGPVAGYFVGVPVDDVAALLSRAGGAVLSAHTAAGGQDGQVFGVRQEPAR